MPNIQYYVVRQDGAEEHLVPMVPIDQLPDWLDIVGVPRELTADESVKMTGLLDIGGRRGGAGGLFQVRVLTTGPGDVLSQPEEDAASVSTVSPVSTPSLSAASANSVAVSEMCNTPALSAAGIADNDACAGEQAVKQPTSSNVSDTGCWRPPYKTDKPAAATIAPGHRVHGPAKAASTPASRFQSATANVMPCKYWCKTGRCGFNTKCRFAHVMPLTSEGLSLVDLTAPPPWYIRKLSGEKDLVKKKTSLPLGRKNASMTHGKAPYIGGSRDTTGGPASPSKMHEPKTEDSAAATTTATETAEMEDLIDFT